ncbi:MAG: methanogenesis marker 2 protein [Methanomassiliicoccales archaeon]|nr:MAG: methanogenesis marker 2 protein [Methanomassiliicoccales archaeon]
MRNLMLSDLVAKVRDYPGLKRKHAISMFVDVLEPVQDFGDTVLGFGEDAAVLRLGDEYILFSSDGIWSKLHADPQWAGYCSVLVNVNDIYAMGGKPVAMTNNISYMMEEEGRLLAEGIKDACHKFRVPMVGGHIHPDSDFLSISVSIVGKTRKLITSKDCQEGNDLIVAIDLDGRKRGELLNWDSTSHKASEVVLHQLGGLNEIAERGLVTAGKDLSNPGILGTIGMLLETSGKGAVVNLDTLPIPEGVDMAEWVLMYPGYGFVLSSQKENSEEVIRVFQERDVEARVVGEVIRGSKFVVRESEEEELLFDFEKDRITGIKMG